MKRELETKEILDTALKNKKTNKIFIYSLIGGFLFILIIIILGILYFINFEKGIDVSAEIEDIYFDDNFENAYIKLNASGELENITKTRFTFKDKQGNEYFYETNETPIQILGGDKDYDYLISALDLELEDLKEIVEISVSFVYETEEGDEIETDTLDTSSTSSSSSSSSSSSDGDDDDDDTCTAESFDITCENLICGIKNNNCGVSVDCGSCSNNLSCVNGLCVNSSLNCENNLDCEDFDDCSEDVCIDGFCTNGGCVDNIYCSLGDLCNHGYCNLAGNCVPITEGMNLNEPDIVVNLGEDLLCNDYITLDAENITLDCRGFKIIEDEDIANNYAIYVTSNAKNMTIKNCEIINFHVGIKNYANKIYGIIENNKIHGGSGGIFEVAPSSKNNIRNNEFYNLSYAGVVDDEGGYLNISGNKFYDCRRGISAGTRNTYLKEIIIDNEFYNNEEAINLHGGGGSIIKGNLIYNNLNGIKLGTKLTNPTYNDIFENNVLFNNTLNFVFYVKNKFGVEGYCDISSNCYEDSFINTTIDGEEILYLIGEENIEITGEIGALFCKNCQNIIIRNVVINSPNRIGMFFYNSSNITFEGNNQIENQETGIYLAKSHDININVEFNNNELDIDSRDSYNNLCNGEGCIRETCLKDADCDVEKHYGRVIPLYSYKRICDNEKCVPECLSNSDCIENPKGEFCYHEGCVDCLVHADCLEEHEMCWWNNTCITLNCENNLDCEDFDDCSEDVCVGGFCEFTRISDSSNCYYCVDLEITRGEYADYTMGRIYGGADFNHDGVFNQTDSSEFYSYLFGQFECDIEICLFCNYVDGSRNLIVGAVGYAGHELPAPEAATRYGTTCRIEGEGGKEPCNWDIDACNSDYDCVSETPYCELASGECFGCLDDGHCTNPDLSFCNINNVCVECADDEDCPLELPFCGPDYTCGEIDGCLSKVDCLENEYCWFNNVCTAFSCTENKDCEDYDDCSADKCVDGYCEFTRFENEEDCYYCSYIVDAFCNDIGGMNICGGADIDRNGSVGQEDVDILQLWWMTVPCNESNLFCDYADIDRNMNGSIFANYGVSTNDLNILSALWNYNCSLEPWRACELGIINEEVCDGFDNDCDSEIDEDDVCGMPSLSFWQTIIDWFKGLFGLFN